MTGEETIPD